MVKISTSHFRSNIAGKLGSETISNFASITGTSLVGAVTGNVTGNVNGTSVIASSYVKVGNKHIMAGNLSTAASIVALATSLAASAGSIYIGDDNLWRMTNSTTAATLPAA